MRFSLFLSLFMGLVGTAASVNAAPILYTINFTGGSPLPTSGSFSYDAGTPRFFSFIVEWNGLQFDLTSTANLGAVFGACDTPDDNRADLFAVLNNPLCGAGSTYWIGTRYDNSSRIELGGGSPSGNGSAGDLRLGLPTAPFFATLGSFTITQATPEPSTIGMIALGGALMTLKRRRGLTMAKQASHN